MHHRIQFSVKMSDDNDEAATALNLAVYFKRTLALSFCTEVSLIFGNYDMINSY